MVTSKQVKTFISQPHTLFVLIGTKFTSSLKHKSNPILIFELTILPIGLMRDQNQGNLLLTNLQNREVRDILHIKYLIIILFHYNLLSVKAGVSAQCQRLVSSLKWLVLQWGHSWWWQLISGHPLKESTSWKKTKWTIGSSITWSRHTKIKLQVFKSHQLETRSSHNDMLFWGATEQQLSVLAFYPELCSNKKC